MLYAYTLNVHGYIHNAAKPSDNYKFLEHCILKNETTYCRHHDIKKDLFSFKSSISLLF